MGIFPNEEEHSKEVTNHLSRINSSGSLFSSGQISHFFFPHLNFLRTLPDIHVHLFAKLDSSAKEDDNTYYGMLPPSFGVFLHMCS